MEEIFPEEMRTNVTEIEQFKREPAWVESTHSKIIKPAFGYVNIKEHMQRLTRKANHTAVVFFCPLCPLMSASGKSAEQTIEEREEFEYSIMMFQVKRCNPRR